jgi:hypothetical protein
MSYSTLGLDLKVTGNTGHGSRFIEKTAAEKLVILGFPFDYFMLISKLNAIF